jgi:hypothetical protein
MIVSCASGAQTATADSDPGPCAHGSTPGPSCNAAGPVPASRWSPVVRGPGSLPAGPYFVLLV